MASNHDDTQTSTLELVNYPSVWGSDLISPPTPRCGHCDPASHRASRFHVRFQDVVAMVAGESPLDGLSRFQRA